MNCECQRRAHARSARRVVLAILVGLVPTVVVAQQPSIELQLESQVLEVGETVTARLVCTNTGVPSLPESDTPEGLSLKLLNTTPSTQSMTQIINGRVSRKSTYTFSMQLTALKAGTFTLGPISVQDDQSSYQTRALQIVVRNSEDTPKAHGDRYIFAEIDVKKRSLYVSESLTATLTIGIRKVQISGQTLEMDLLRKVLDQGRSQFSVFAEGDVRRTERRIADSRGVRHRYEIFHVTKRIRAEEVGTLLVGPVFLKANYPVRVRRGFFGGYEVAQHRKETARVAALTVEVKAPPEEGRPPDYTGAIGRYSMSVSARPGRVEQGKPVTLAISITGAPLEGVAGPDLTKQPELASRFDFTADELVGDKEGQAKVFRRAIFPKQAGEQSVPPLRWSYFDPSRERYVTVVSKPIEIIVDPASRDSPAISLTDSVNRGPETVSLTLLSGGISPNFVNVDAVLADQSFTLTVPWAVSLIVSPLVWLLVNLTTKHRDRLKTDANFARRRRAGRTARGRIARAVKNGEADRQLYVLGEAVTGFICDRFDRGGGTLTPNEARSILRSHGVGESLVGEIVEFLQMCDTFRYAPGAHDARTVSQAAADVSGWIKRIEREVR